MRKTGMIALLLSVVFTAVPVMAEETEHMADATGVSETEVLDEEVQSMEGPLIVEDGMMQPMAVWSDLRDAHYSNDDSDILRFCVYVETDLDTDADGLADLVKVFVQVPRAAAEGKYKAGTIYDPTPYGAGTIDQNQSSQTYDYTGVFFDYEKLGMPGQKRTPADSMSTMDAAMSADPKDWNYGVPQTTTGAVGFSYAKIYDYYLVRGFAVVECSGIGTYGSEGFELCGTEYERDSHKAVVEWLTGDRIAYTDPWSDIEIKADWSNGKVAMTGASYGGTLPFSVAVTGVKGLETIIPVAGIADWYDYANSQGVPLNTEAHYTDGLAGFVSLGTYLDKDVIVPNEEYGQWLMQVAKDQDDANGDYAPVWDALDYTHHAENLSCSALLVTGLNDFNVMTRHFDLMYHAFKNAGLTVKGVLHQDGHNFLYGKMVNGELWDEIMNKWLSHYLYGVDNGIENMEEITVQSNVDGSWKTYSSLDEAPYSDLSVQYEKEESTVTSSGLAWYATQYLDEHGADLSRTDYRDDFYMSLGYKNAAFYAVNIPESRTIYGTPEVHVRLKTEDTEWDGLMISAILIDTTDQREFFDAFLTKDAIGEILPVRVIGKYDLGGGKGKDTITEYVQTKTDGKCITYGWTDLCNPGMGKDSTEYVMQDDLVEGQYYDYTFYMQPTSYTVQEGHELLLVLMTWDPFRAFLDMTGEMDLEAEPQVSEYDYSYTVDNASINVRLPLPE